MIFTIFRLIRVCVILTFCWLVLSVKLHGQANNVSVEQLSTKDGLSHSIITCTLQDKDGFIWIGTQDGLNRFDGYSFVVYEHDPTDKNSISNNVIKCLYEDQAGTLWVGTYGGLNKFNKKSNTFQAYHHESVGSNSLSSDHIQSIYEDASHTLWIGTYAGLDKFNPKTHAFTLYEHEPGHPDKWKHNEITKIYEDRQGNFWVGTNRGISRFDRKSLRFTRYFLPTIAPEDINPQHSVRDILEDRTGTLWVATTGDGLATLDRKTSQFAVFLPNQLNSRSGNSVHIMALYEDSFGTLWIGTQDKGLCRLDRSTGMFISTPLNPASAYYRNTINSIYEDRSHVLWIGTYEAGLSKLDLLRKKFTHVFHEDDTPTIRKNDVTALFEDHTGAIWVGNGLGLDKLDKSSGTYSYYNYPAPAPKNLWENNAQCIYEDKNQDLWIGLLGGGLKKYTRQTRQFTTYLPIPGDSSSLPNGIVNAICQDKRGRLWVGTRFGLARFDEKTKKFTTYRPPFLATRQMDVTKIVEDRAGRLWLAADQSGLLRFDPQTERFTPYTYKASSSRRATQAIYQLYEDRTGRLWMTLQDGGLVYMDRTEKLRAVMEPKLLTKTFITGILEDDKGNLWLSTSKNGLYKFNPTTKALAVYDALDGLQANEFSSACCKSQDGKMYFGGKNGFTTFYPDSIKSNPYAPIVVINSFKVLDKPRSLVKEIKLPYYENFISFDFAALSYAFPKRSKYAYQLEGFDKEWVMADTRRYASFTNLEPGDYVFRVKAANHDGIWNSEGTSVKISIAPPIWKTTAAYLFYVALFIGMIAGLRRYIISQERLKNTLLLSNLESEKLLELDQLKSRFFTSISHEFRTPLTLIISPLEKNLSSEQKGRFIEPEVRLMLRNAKRLLELINQLLDISKLEAKKMQWEATPGDMMPLLKATVFSFMSFAESKPVKLTFESQLDSLITQFDKDKLEKIVTNLLANALKFTLKGEVKVTVSLKTTGEKQWVIIEIKDTGIGIPADRIGRIFDRFYQVDSSHTREFEGSGIGLTLTKELVELHQGTIRATSTVGVGTCFTVEIPLVEVTNETPLIPDLLPESFLPSPASSVDTTHWDESMLSPELADEQVPLLLIVEDNADLRAYVRTIFQHKYRLLEASNGQEGLQMALDAMPDLIVTDWMMPKMDGVQLCHQIKTDERTSHIPLILLTAKATVQSKIEALETGADDYITKPFHTEELFIRAKNLIAQRQRLRERWSKEFALVPAAELASPNSISALTMNAVDERFLQRLILVIEANLGDADFTIEALEKEAGMSHTTLYSKLKALTNQSPSEFVRCCRLQQAATLLAQFDTNVSEVAFQVGFANLSYFTKCFRQQYGTTPSQYARTHSNSNEV